MQHGRERKDSDYGIPSGEVEKSKIQAGLEAAISASLASSQKGTNAGQDSTSLPKQHELSLVREGREKMSFFLSVTAICISAVCLVGALVKTSTNQTSQGSLQKSLDNLTEQEIPSLKAQLEELKKQNKLLQDRLQLLEKKPAQTDRGFFYRSRSEPPLNMKPAENQQVDSDK